MTKLLEVDEVKKLETQIQKGLEEYTHLTVDIPDSKKEYKRRFNLINEEINIDEVEFDDFTEDIFSLTVKIPDTKKEYSERFGI